MATIPLLSRAPNEPAKDTKTTAVGKKFTCRTDSLSSRGEEQEDFSDNGLVNYKNKIIVGPAKGV